MKNAIIILISFIVGLVIGYYLGGTTVGRKVEIEYMKSEPVT